MNGQKTKRLRSRPRLMLSRPETKKEVQLLLQNINTAKDLLLNVKPQFPSHFWMTKGQLKWKGSNTRLVQGPVLGPVLVNLRPNLVHLENVEIPDLLLVVDVNAPKVTLRLPPEVTVFLWWCSKWVGMDRGLEVESRSNWGNPCKWFVNKYLYWRKILALTQEFTWMSILFTQMKINFKKVCLVYTG